MTLNEKILQKWCGKIEVNQNILANDSIWTSNRIHYEFFYPLKIVLHGISGKELKKSKKSLLNYYKRGFNNSNNFVKTLDFRLTKVEMSLFYGKLKDKFNKLTLNYTLNENLLSIEIIEKSKIDEIFLKLEDFFHTNIKLYKEEFTDFPTSYIINRSEEYFKSFCSSYFNRRDENFLYVEKSNPYKFEISLGCEQNFSEFSKNSITVSLVCSDFEKLNKDILVQPILSTDLLEKNDEYVQNKHFITTGTSFQELLENRQGEDSIIFEASHGDKYDYIFNVLLPLLKQNCTNERLLTKFFLQCLEFANKLYKRSLALPVLHASCVPLTYSQYVNILCSSIKKFLEMKHLQKTFSTVRNVTLVCVKGESMLEVLPTFLEIRNKYSSKTIPSEKENSIKLAKGYLFDEKSDVYLLSIPTTSKSSDIKKELRKKFNLKSSTSLKTITKNKNYKILQIKQKEKKIVYVYLIFLNNLSDLPAEIPIRVIFN